MIENKPRIYGIDLLRIIVMFFVVVLHICNQSGIEKTPTAISQQSVYCLYKTLTCIAVNVFAIISGYVGYDKSQLKISKLIELWITVVFYGIVISAVLMFDRSQTVRIADIIKAALPVTLKQYWYFSAYVGLFFLMPLINSLVQHLSACRFFQTAVATICIFSLYGIISVFFSDPFVMNGGYSLFWLAILYYLGAGINRFNITPKVSQKRLAVLALIIWLVNASSLLILRFVGSVTSINLISAMAEYLFHAYVSPAVMTLSLAVFFLFANLKDIPISKNILLACSSSAFSVYLIHSHPLLWNSYFRNASQWILDCSAIEMLVCIPAMAILIFLFCIVIDIIRAKLFSLVKTHVLIQRLEQIITRIFDKLVDKCSKTWTLSIETTPIHDSMTVSQENHERE